MLFSNKTTLNDTTIAAVTAGASSSSGSKIELFGKEKTGTYADAAAVAPSPFIILVLARV